ncbi:MAG: DNA polymerase Y family protein [Ancalomicrobiaceae bacterium]|nr:DNA polymerase Y family protein [Ancalomicrobiaceae bacterium]
MAKPFVLVTKEASALRLAAVDRLAAEAGLRAGMTYAEARARVPAFDTQETEPQADAALLAECAEASDMFTPLVALDGADGLMLDVTGCAHLFGGERALGIRVARTFRAKGLSLRAAFAATPDAAAAFARHFKGVIADGTETGRLARMLPIATLDDGSERVTALRRSGFSRLADLADRPSQVLVARFGAELVTKLRRLLGQEDIRITPIRPPPALVADRRFAEPVTAMEHLLLTLGDLVDDIAQQLERRGEGGQAFLATLFRADGEKRRLAIDTARPTRDAASLKRLFQLRIDTLADPIDPGFGFDAMRLAVLRADAIMEVQARLDGGTGRVRGGEGAREDGGETIADLVDRLMVRFGAENVLSFAGSNSHDPVRAGRAVPVAEMWNAGAPAPWPEREPGHPPSRPLTLFPTPQPIEALAEVPDGPPLRFRWRRVVHEVARSEGPERIAAEWWRCYDAPPPTRDYYRLEDVLGRRFWVFREGSFADEVRPRWFLHGLFA